MPARVVGEGDSETMSTDGPLVKAAWLEAAKELHGTLQPGKLGLLHWWESPVVQCRCERIITHRRGQRQRLQAADAASQLHM